MLLVLELGNVEFGSDEGGEIFQLRDLLFGGLVACKQCLGLGQSFLEGRGPGVEVLLLHADFFHRKQARARTAGPAALRRDPPPGRQPRLTTDQRAQLPELLERGPEAWWFCGNLWTRSRIALVIQEVFGVNYDPSQVERILRSLRLSPQKPLRRARQRREEHISQWRETDAPALKKWP